MTKTYEQIERENQELKKKLRKKEADADAETIMGFMAGRVGNGYAQWASGEY
jgi:hypothetical protein